MSREGTSHPIVPTVPAVRRSSVVTVLAGVLLASGASSQQSGAFKPVSFAILEDYDKGQDLDDVERDFVLFRELETGTWRGSVGWEDYELVRGQFDFECLHRFASTRRATGFASVHTSAIPSRGPHDAGSPIVRRGTTRRADVRRWERFARELARAMRRHSSVASFEICRPTGR